MTQPSGKHFEVSLLRVGFAGVPPPLFDAEPVLDFFRQLGVTIDVRELGPVRLAKPIGVYARHGGMGRAPQNSQTVAEQALLALEEAQRLQTREQLLLLAPQPFWPHTWRLLHGGLHVGERRYCRRYALVPEHASLGACAHELGHLFFDWPDWPKESGIERECLMGIGGYAERGARPSRPSPPLLIDSGLAHALTLEADTPLAALANDAIAEFWYRGERFLFAWQTELERLLMYRLGASVRDAKLVARVPASTRDSSRPVLAMTAPALLVSV